MKNILRHWYVVPIIVVGILAIAGTARLVNHSKVAIIATPKSNTVDVTDSTKWSVSFSDDFKGTQLDNSKWVTCYDWQNPSENGCTNGGNAEQQWYTPDQVTVKDGVATLTAIKQPVTVPSVPSPITYGYQSGMISTGRAYPDASEKWSASYGYFESRIKVQGGTGIWPAFWLLPIDRSWPPEIDIMELVGSRPQEVLQTYHWLDSANQKQKSEFVATSDDYTKGWHTYAVNWQPQRIDWYIDGKLTRTATGDAVPNKPMEIILNLAVGGRLPGNADETTPFPRAMLIDYVRVYGMKQ